MQYEVIATGFIIQVSLIFALGAQNIFILECGLNKTKPYMVATICSILDTCLIFMGVLGAGSIFATNPYLKIIFAIAGSLFLFYYGAQKIFTKPQLNLNAKKAPNIIAKTFIVSLLNPHAYLDAIVLLGGYTAIYNSLLERGLFALGASLASIIWFVLLASLAKSLSKLLHTAQHRQKIFLLAGIVLIILALKLGHDAITWLKLVN